MAPVHERMPVIIASENWKDWLTKPFERVESLVASYTDSEMQAWPVDRRVGKTVEEGAGLIEPIDEGR